MGLGKDDVTKTAERYQFGVGCISNPALGRRNGCFNSTQ